MPSGKPKKSAMKKASVKKSPVVEETAEKSATDNEPTSNMPSGKDRPSGEQAKVTIKSPVSGDTHTCGNSKRPPVLYDEAKGEQMMLIRFKSDSVLKVENSFKAEKSVLQNYKGTLVGITNQGLSVECVGKEKLVGGYGFAVLTFPTGDDGMRWITSDRIFKQADFPNAADALSIAMFPLNYIPKDNNYHTFMVCLISNMAQDFQAEYVDKATRAMNNLSVRHGLVATTEIEQVRHSNWMGWNPFLVVNVFKDPQHFYEFYYSEEYEKPKQYSKGACSMNTFIFDLKGRSLERRQ